MGIREIIEYTLLALLFLAVCLFYEARDMGMVAINERLNALETAAYTAMPQIRIERGTVYAGSGEITIEKLENEKGDLCN